MTNEMRHRIAMMTALVESARNQKLGRTAIMKLLYLLSAIKDVHLGYYFTLYSYGPFDSAVLEDIDYAARLGALTVQTTFYPKGYGYDIRPGDAAATTKQWDAEFLVSHQDDIDWAIEEFAELTAAELELVSTIVYVDREWAQFGRAGTMDSLAQRVNEIKQHFSVDVIRHRIENLDRRQMLASL